MFEKLKKKLDHAKQYSEWTATAHDLRTFIGGLPYMVPLSILAGTTLAVFAPMLMGGPALTAIGAITASLSIPLIGSGVFSVLSDIEQQRKTVTFENDVGQIIQSSAAQQSILNKAERSIRNLSRLLETAETEFKRTPLRKELSETFAVAKGMVRNVAVLEAGEKGASVFEYNYQTHKSPKPVSFFKTAA